MAETKTTPQAGTGRIARVNGPVVDIEFPHDAIPEIYNALTTEIDLLGETTTLTLEVAQHLGDDLVRAIALKPTDGLVRGGTVSDTGAPISVPVGDVTKGHVFNVTGEVLNAKPGEKLRLPSVGQFTVSRQLSTSLSQRLRCSKPESRLLTF